MRFYTVAADILALTVRTRRLVRGRLEPYHRRPGDVVREGKLYRDGQFAGTVGGEEDGVLIVPARLEGQKLDTAWADSTESYRIAAADDPSYASPVTPDAVHRKSHPTEFVRVVRGNALARDMPVEHRLYLKLPHALTPGRTYRVSFPGGPWEEQSFRFDPATVRSEAVHVAHLGFRPDDPVKVAFLSCWLGSGGALSYPDGTGFRVLEDESGEVAFEGTIRLARAADDVSLDDFKRNYNGTDVYELDFSDLAEPGTYRVCVDGVGCSFPFEIGEGVWERGYRAAARGIYHMRVGVQFGPPHTMWRVPRYFHPDQGDVVREGPVAFDVHIMRKEPRYEEGKLGPVLPGVWGGHRDAGGYQHQPRNMRAAWYLLDLVELFPEHFAGIGHNIPESDNDLPDALDEALFGLDLYRRLQTPEGGIRGGVFTVGNLVGGWSHDRPRIAYKPGCIASYVYVVGAARAAGVLTHRDAELAKQYRESAVRAMEWAEGHWREWPYPRNLWTMRRRAAAAAEMFRLTGEERWHEAFHDSFGAARLAEEPRWEEREAAWIYARIERPEVDAELRARCRDLIVENADFVLDHVNRTAFGWAKRAPDFNVIGCLGAPRFGPALVRAHVLTGDPRYLAGAVRACQTGLGANPLNTCYTTWLGHRSPRNRFNLDCLGLISPPPDGWSLPGPMDMRYLGSDDYFHQESRWVYNAINAHAWPDLSEWPALESYFDVFWLYPMHEGTVQGGVSWNAFTWGYLSARDQQEFPGDAK